MDSELQATDMATAQTFDEPSSQALNRSLARTQPSSEPTGKPSTDAAIEDLVFPCTRLEAASALKTSDVTVGNRLKNLKKYHAESDLLTDGNRITEFGFNAVRLYGELGKRAYEAQHASDVPAPTAEEISASGDRGGGLAVREYESPFAIVAEIVEDTAPQQHSQYRNEWGELAKQSQSDVDEILDEIGDDLNEFVRNEVLSGISLADAVSKVKHKAIATRMRTNDKKFFADLASTNEKARGEGKSAGS